MNKTKLFVWLLLLGLLALLAFQNRPFLLDTRQSLRLYLGILPEYRSPDLPVVVFMVFFFVLGMLFTYFFGMPERMRQRKSIKRLSANADSQEKEIASLKVEVANLKGIGTPGEKDERGASSSVTSPISKS